MRLFHFSLMFIFIAGLNSSEEERDPSHISYTDSENDPASPSRDGSASVTRLPDISGLWSVSVRQGGGYSGSGDNTRLYAVPQESTHNGQEKAGSVISDLTYTTPHSLTDSTLSFTEQDSSLSSAETQWPGRSVSALTTAINAYTRTDTDTLPEKVSRTTKIYVNVHDDAETPSVHADVLNTLESEVVQGGDITVTSSAHTVSGSHLTALGNRASVTELETSESHRFHEVTDRGDASVMSPSYAASEGRNHSSDTFRTDHLSRNSPDFSVTDGSNSVSGLEVSEFNSVTYTSDRAARPSQYKEASRTNRLPRSTHINQNVSNHTPSSLFDDSGTTTDTPRASVSHRQTETSTLSDSHLDASEDVTSTTRKSTEYYSNTSYYNSSPNTDSTPTDSTPTDSTPTDSTPTDSATTQAPHTIHGEHTTVHEHTTTQCMSDPNTQHSSPEVPPTQTMPSSPATPTTQDFTSTPASYSAYALDQGDPISSTTLHTSFLTSVITRDPSTTLEGSITAPYDTTEPKSSTGTEGQTQSGDDNHITRTSDLNNLSQVTTLSPESRPTTITRHTSSTSRNDPATPTTLNPAATSMSRLTSASSHSLDPASTSTPLANQNTFQTIHLITTTRRNETRVQNHLTTSRNTPIIRQPDTTTQQVSTNTRSQTLTPAITQTSTRRTLATRIVKDWSQKGRVFIMEDQPANISVETFQVLLQVILEENSPPYAGLVEVEPFLQKVAGYQSQHVTWHSGPVLQSLVTFRTSEAVSWLARAESLLQEAGLKPLPTRGVFVSGVRVKNITVGGLHSDVCSWAFSCPSDFYCVSSEGNVTCRSLCHSEYCNNHGICVHPSGQHPLCRCPVGEDFWFMGQRCDLRMTRQRLAAVCFGVLAAIAAVMGLLAFLAVQRFKKRLIQAKAEQTQSSYRRFNHFDELSARFWRRSWPGSEDSQDNIAFSRSDELLHMRALDRACCYHDDTLSIASTYPDSVTHLNTVYPHSSQYQWEMSTCSLADGVIDSGKASDLSVCSWPIEPIQWTPFPLLQQLRNTNTIKPSRPRSYCEGMELVGLEKSRTA